jgi:hypothetical protein
MPRHDGTEHRRDARGDANDDGWLGHGRGPRNGSGYGRHEAEVNPAGQLAAVSHERGARDEREFGFGGIQCAASAPSRPLGSVQSTGVQGAHAHAVTERGRRIDDHSVVVLKPIEHLGFLRVALSDLNDSLYSFSVLNDKRAPVTAAAE